MPQLVLFAVGLPTNGNRDLRRRDANVGTRRAIILRHLLRHDGPEKLAGSLAGSLRDIDLPPRTGSDMKIILVGIPVDHKALALAPLAAWQLVNDYRKYVSGPGAYADDLDRFPVTVDHVSDLVRVCREKHRVDLILDCVDLVLN